jgi:hypothetical protein
MPYGLTEERIEWIREGYRMLREGDPAYLDRYDPNAELTFPDSLPAGGTYAGVFDAAEYFTTQREHWEGAHAEPEEFFAVDDAIIVLGTVSGRARATGVEFEAPFAHVMRVRDDKIVNLRVYVDTAKALSSLEPAGS